MYKYNDHRGGHSPSRTHRHENKYRVTPQQTSLATAIAFTGYYLSDFDCKYFPNKKSSGKHVSLTKDGVKR